MPRSNWSGIATESVTTVWENAKDQLASHMPFVVGGLAILFGGWLTALVARKVTERILRGLKLNQAVEGSRVGAVIKSLGNDWTASRLLGALAYFTILLLTLSAAADHFGLDGVQAALAAALAYLPKAVAGLGILAAGAYFSTIAKRSVGAVLRELRNPAAGVLASGTEAGILLIATLVALDVLGVDLSFITSNLTMLLGAALVVVVFLGCWALRLPAEQLAANYYLRRMLSVGDHVQTSAHQGLVLEFQPLGVVLRDGKGDEHFVPAKNLISGMRRSQGLTPD